MQPRWRTFETLTRLEITPPTGQVQAWVPLPLSQDAGYRQCVDEKLQEIILEDPFDFDVDVLEVTGSPQVRVRRVLENISNRG